MEVLFDIIVHIKMARRLIEQKKIKVHLKECLHCSAPLLYAFESLLSSNTAQGNNYDTYGIYDHHNCHSGRKQTGDSDENVEIVRELVSC